MPVKLQRISSWVFAAVTAACVIASKPYAAGSADDEGSPIYGVKIPAGYRGWEVVSVAHEAGNLNDIRAILGNPVTMKAFRDGTRPFPDGTIIARLAWKDVPSDENNAVFGRFQSFVAGPATNVQFMVKDTKKYPSTGGWGFGQFEDAKPTRDEAVLKTCFPCHEPEKGRDFVFTRYAP
jgi:Cytochrome P460